MAVVFAMMASAIPRVGGDYVWQSRTFGGFVGFTVIFAGYVFMSMLYAATNWSGGGLTSVAPVFLVLGSTLQNESLINLSAWMGTANGLWWGYVFYCVFSYIILVAGMRWYGRIQRWSFYIGCVAIVGWVVMFFTTTRQDFISSYNLWMSTYFHWGGANPYQYVLSQAASSGYQAVSLTQIDLSSTFALMPVMAYVFVFVTWTGALSGEIGGIADLKKSIWMYVGATLFALVICAGTMYLTLSVVGNEFFFSGNYLWYTGTSGMPIAPFIGFLYLVMTRNPIFWIITLFGMNAWFWIWNTNNWVNGVRISFAMSFDRALPDRIGALSTKLRAPVNAITLFTVGALIMGWLYFFTTFSQWTLDVIVGTGATIAASTLAGTVMPYMKSTKAVWEASPASKYKVGSVPVITICGILALVFLWLPCYYLWITDNRYGVNSALSSLFLIGSFVGSAILYLGMKWYRKRHGIDLDLVFREIPYE